jgi:hypothetical protein
MTKPRVFVGSAGETRHIVDALEAELHHDAIIERWDVDVFRPGHFTLEELTTAVTHVDFAIFVLGREDVTESRGVIAASPRDNVVFEAGLFTAVLGREKTFFIVDKVGTKIPSDWAGLGYLVFDDSELRPRDKIFDAVVAIRRRFAEWQPLGGLGLLGCVVGSWWQFVINVDAGSILSLLDIAASSPASVEVDGTSWDADGSLRARYHSRVAHFDEKDLTLYYYWSGQLTRGQGIPRHFGVGEITFNAKKETLATKGEGWYSTSNAADVTDSQTKSTLYFRASTSDLVVMRGADGAKRASLVQSKLLQRRELLV